MIQREYSIDADFDGLRIDRALSWLDDKYTRSALEKLIIAGCVTVNGKTADKSYKVKKGDVVVLLAPEPRSIDAQPQRIDLDIVYEDQHLLVVNKPRGMVVHPSAGHFDGTLVNALLHHCGDSLSGINGVIRPGIVHRIDKDTSGLLIVAKDDAAHNGLAQQIKQHSFTRVYEAILCGNLKDDAGVVDAPIGRHRTDRIKMAVVKENSKNAVTHYSVIQRLNGPFTHVECRLETGRTHQIRVHMAYIGHPVAGDPLYGNKGDKSGMPTQLLHARTIGFVHPIDGEYMEFSCPPPQYFLDFIAKHGGNADIRTGEIYGEI